MEKSYIKNSINYIESTEKMKKLRAYQQDHPWAKVRYLAIGYVAFWGLKIAAIAYAPEIINNMKESFNQNKQGQLENVIDSTRIKPSSNLEITNYEMREEDTILLNKIHCIEELTK